MSGCVYLSVWARLFVSELLILVGSRKRERANERSLPAELFAHFPLFTSLLGGGKKKKGEAERRMAEMRQRPAVRQNEERWLAETESERERENEKVSSVTKDGWRETATSAELWEREIKIKRRRADGDGGRESFPFWQAASYFSSASDNLEVD